MSLELVMYYGVKEEDDGGGTNKEGDHRDARHDKTRGIM